MRWDVSHSAEAGAAVGNLYLKVLGRPVDTSSQSHWRDAMGSTWALRDVRLEVAHSAEARVDFDAAYYLQQNQDVAAAEADLYLHYIDYGAKEGRNPNAFLSSSYYLQQNPDVAAYGMNPLLHYRTYGWHEGRDPSAQFSTTAYLDAYRDVAAAGMDPLTHFLTYGQNEGRHAFTSGSNAVYIEKMTIIIDRNGQQIIQLPDNDIIGHATREAFHNAPFAPGSSADIKTSDPNVRQALSAFAFNSAVFIPFGYISGQPNNFLRPDGTFRSCSTRVGAGLPA